MTSKSDGAFHYCREAEQLEWYINILWGGGPLAGDTETYALPKWGAKGSALDPHTGRVSVLILKGRDTLPVLFDILVLESQGADFSKLLQVMQEAEYLLFHNAKFDLKMLFSTFGVLFENVRDTMLYAQLVGNATGSKIGAMTGYSLEDLCRDLLDIHLGGKGTLQKSTWHSGVSSRTLENRYWVEKLTYAAADVEHLFPLEDILRPAVINPLPDSPLTKTGRTENFGLGMENILDTEFKYLPLLAEREYRGLHVSATALRQLQEGVNERLNEVACELCEAFNLDKPRPNWEGILMPTSKAMKALRSSQELLKMIKQQFKLRNLNNVQAHALDRILEIMESLDSLEEVNDEAVAAVFIDEDEEALYRELTDYEESDLATNCKIMKLIIEFKRLQKQSGMDLRRYVNPVTGRIHCNISQLRAATGRTACSSPNLQQVSNRIGVEVEMPLSDLFERDIEYIAT